MNCQTTYNWWDHITVDVQSSTVYIQQLYIPTHPKDLSKYREKCATNPCNILRLHTIFIWYAYTMHQYVASDIVYLSLQTNKHTWTLIANLKYLIWTKLQHLCKKSGDFQTIWQNRLKDMTCRVMKYNWVTDKNIGCNPTKLGEKWIMVL
jgi:hypothetical protein